MLKNIIFSLLALFTFAFAGHGATPELTWEVSFESSTGVDATFSFIHHPVLSFTGNSLLIKNNNDWVEVQLDDFIFYKVKHIGVSSVTGSGIDGIRFHNRTISVNLGCAASLTVYDINGHQRFSANIDFAGGDIVFDDLPAGVYIVKINSLNFKILLND